VISLMAGGLTQRERAAVDKAILKTYKEAEGGEAPLLSDLHAALAGLGQLELNEKLDKYLTGSLAGVLNRPTNIKLDNRLVVFDIKDLDESLRPEKRILVIDDYGSA